MAPPSGPPTALLVDNYDSYTFNIKQLLESSGCRVRCIRNDEASWEEIEWGILPYCDFVVLGPGPGDPATFENFGVSSRFFGADAPVLGICLGHQGLAAHFGGTLSIGSRIVHGQQTIVHHHQSSIFSTMLSPCRFVRYNSLQVRASDLPPCLRLLAWSFDDRGEVEVMAIEHVEKCFVGVQFHPESVMSNGGLELVQAWMAKMALWNARTGRVVRHQNALNIRPVPSLRASPNTIWELKTSAIEWLDPECLAKTLVDSNTYFVWLDGARDPPSGPRMSYIGIPSKTHGVFITFDEDDVLTVQCGHQVWPFVKRLLPRPLLRDSLIEDKVVASFGPGDCFSWLDTFSASFQLESLNYPALIGGFGYGMRRHSLCGAYRKRGHYQRPKLAKSIRRRLDAAFVFVDKCFEFHHNFGSARVYRASLLDDGGVHSPPRRSQSRAFSPASFDWVNKGHCTKYTFGTRIGLGSSKNSLETQREQYHRQVRWCLENIRHGESYEMCLTTKFHLSMPVRAPKRRSFAQECFDIYSKQRARNPASYSVFFILHQTCLLSSSPELFAEISLDELSLRRVMEMRPMKGTRRRSNDPRKDEEARLELERSEKDRGENLMIVDLVRNELNTISDDVSVRALMVVESHEHVHQMTSTVRGVLREDIGWPEAIRATFPPGSMTGAPKLRTIQLLEHIEGTERGMYSGVFGYAGHACRFNVVIRSLLVEEEEDGAALRCSVGAGGALTVLSDAEDEWLEAKLKAETVIGLG